jgi:hypothetical protein
MVVCACAMLKASVKPLQTPKKQENHPPTPKVSFDLLPQSRKTGISDQICPVQ